MYTHSNTEPRNGRREMPLYDIPQQLSPAPLAPGPSMGGRTEYKNINIFLFLPPSINGPFIPQRGPEFNYIGEDPLFADPMLPHSNSPSSSISSYTYSSKIHYDDDGDVIMREPKKKTHNNKK